MTSALFRSWLESPLEPVPTGLMALATVGWVRGSLAVRTESDQLELMMACAMLNAVALTYWCVSRDDARAFIDWGIHALLCGFICLALSLPRLSAHRNVPSTLGPALGYVGMALLATVLSAIP